MLAVTRVPSKLLFRTATGCSLVRLPLGVAVGAGVAGADAPVSGAAAGLVTEVEVTAGGEVAAAGPPISAHPPQNSPAQASTAKTAVAPTGILVCFPHFRRLSSC